MGSAMCRSVLQGHVALIDCCWRVRQNYISSLELIKFEQSQYIQRPDALHRMYGKLISQIENFWKPGVINESSAGVRLLDAHA